MRTVCVRRWSLASATGVALLLIAACSSSGGSSSSSGAAQTSKSPSAQAQQPNLAAANKEGELVWYTSLSGTDTPKITAAFNKVYPKIKITVLRLDSDQIPAKISLEQKAGEYNADVVTGPPPYIPALITSGALAPYDPPGAAALPKGLSMPAGYSGVYDVTTTVIAYNPTALKAHHLTTPTTWADLTKPQWKGQFSMSTDGIDLYQELIAEMGHTKALSLIQAMGKNSPRLASSHTQALMQVEAGEPIATAAAYGYNAAKAKKATPSQIDFVNTTPLPANVTLIDLVKNAPHPDAAKVFIDWMVSKAGQDAVVGLTNRTSLLPGTGNDPTVWNPSRWPIAWANPTVSAAEYTQLDNEYLKAIGAP